MTSHAIGSRTDSLRAIPLQRVLLAAGAQPDPFDKTKWRTPHGVLSLTGSKFFNWNRNVGGGGAIDLAMHLNGSGFHDALDWLVGLGEPSRAPPAPPPRPRPLTLPVPVAHNLPTARRYLADERRLPMNLLRRLIDAGHLYADAHANAVFILADAHDTHVGAELRGTGPIPWRGMASGSRKDIGFFRIGATRPNALVLCESAIDAISCLALFPDRLCISTSGARPSPLWLQNLIASTLPIYCGFDSDPTGETMAQIMIARHPCIHRLRPPLHDWNDALRAHS